MAKLKKLQISGIKTVDQLLERDNINDILDQVATMRSRIDQLVILIQDNKGQTFIIDSDVDPGDGLLLLEAAKSHFLEKHYK